MSIAFTVTFEVYFFNAFNFFIMKIHSKLLSKIFVLFAFVQFNGQSTAFGQLTFSISIGQQSCNNDGSASLVISGGSPPYTCYWSGGGIYGSGTAMNNLPAGCYSIYAYDTLGNSGDTSFVIGVIQIDSLVTTPEHCIASDGTASIYINGGTPTFVYAWDNGVVNTSTAFSNTLTNLVSGIYGITVTDANGCMVTYLNDSLDPYVPSGNISNYVLRTSPITLTMSTTECNCNDGSATAFPANGTPPYTYYWDNISPVQVTQTASGLDAFTYTYLTVTDAVGCKAYDAAEIHPGPNYIESLEQITYTVCPSATGSITIIPSGGTPPYSLLWNTGDTSATISNLAYGTYFCTITDASGCSVVRDKFVDQISPLSISLDIDSATCGNADGRVIASVSGGAPPYTYLWSDGTTNSIAFLEAGWQYISVIDTNNCPALGQPFYVRQPNSCYVILNGTVFHDLNGNCIQDGGDFGLGYPDINVTPFYFNDEFLYTNKWGFYSMRKRPGNIIINQNVPASWSLACPASPSINISALAGQTYVNDYYDHPDSLFDDWSIYHYCFGDTIVHGIERALRIRWRNSGTTILNGNVELHLDPKMVFLHSIPAPSVYDSINHIAYYPLFNQRPRWFDDIILTLLVPSTIPLGDTVQFTSVINPVNTDARQLDNSDTTVFIVAGSFDPNCKTVTPKGTGQQGYISTADSILHYTVYFQNTGTWPAYHVRIVDTLDNNLDANSILPELTSSYYNNYLFSLSGRVATFDFPYIYLPDSTRDEPGSHGFVSFTIRLKHGLHIGDVIPNRAYIYFDFNEAIITNKVVNTIQSLIGVEEIFESDETISIFPNPVHGHFKISYPGGLIETVSVTIYDALGRKVYRRTADGLENSRHFIEFNARNFELPEGIYIAEIQSGQKSFRKKFLYGK